jgi:hypothetical protein
MNLIIEDEPRAANHFKTMLHSCSFDYQLLDIIDSGRRGNWFQHSAPGTAVPGTAVPGIGIYGYSTRRRIKLRDFSEIEKSPIIFTTWTNTPFRRLANSVG